MEEANDFFLNNYFWFDWECKLVRRNVRRFLKKYRRSLLADDRDAFCLARRENKNSLKKKNKTKIVAVEQTDFISEKSERLLGICTYVITQTKVL